MFSHQCAGVHRRAEVPRHDKLENVAIANAL